VTVVVEIETDQSLQVRSRHCFAESLKYLEIVLHVTCIICFGNVNTKRKIYYVMLLLYREVPRT
jgi:hypothetical protein